MPSKEKNYRYRPLEYAVCEVCGAECRRRGRDPWVHFGNGGTRLVSYWQLLQDGRTTEHEAEVKS